MTRNLILYPQICEADACVSISLSIHYIDGYSGGVLNISIFNNLVITDMLRICIRSYAVAVAIIGSISMIFFFPSAKGCNEIAACLPYSITGFVLLVLGVGLFLLKDLARKGMVLLSIIFTGYFTFETVWLIKTDTTGQGLVGMVLLSPILLVCLSGLILLTRSGIRREFSRAAG